MCLGTLNRASFPRHTSSSSSSVTDAPGSAMT
jgi:hypothetical protein